MPVNTAQNEHWGMANAPDLGRRRLRSSFSIAVARQLFLKTQVGQCAFKYSGGGSLDLSSSARISSSALSARSNALASLIFLILKPLPWRILPNEGRQACQRMRTEAHSASRNSSSLLTFSLLTKMTGM